MPAHLQTVANANPCLCRLNISDDCNRVCRSVLEMTGRSDWKDVLQGKHGKDDRSGLGIYGTTKLFNIMLAKEYSRRLQVTQLGSVVPQLAKPCCTIYFSSVQRCHVTLLCMQQLTQLWAVILGDSCVL